MNRIAIFLRKTQTRNKFREAILNTLRVDTVNSALLCSGFFQDDANYSAGADLDIMSYRKHFPLHLTTLGLYSYSWRAQYQSFFHRLNTTNASHGFTSAQMRMPSMGWHAKVFIAKINDNPVVGVIGSSNITSRAFGIFTKFNYECDVVLWDEKNIEINSAIEKSIGDKSDILDVIVSNYDSQHHSSSQPLEKRLIDLEKEILSKAVSV